MPEISVFISYRRADTSADAGRLYDALRRRIGRDNLFMDVDSLRPGEDWVEAVEDAVSQSDVLLALIGSDWTDIRDDEGNRRLEDEFDRVRLEIEAALKSDKPVIPVLFERASMPHATDVPDTLRPLLRRHAIRISHATFDGDLRGLLRALKIIERSKEGPPDRQDSAPIASPAPAPAPSPAPAPTTLPSPPASPTPPTTLPPPPPLPSPGPTYFSAPPPPSSPYLGAMPTPGTSTQGRGSDSNRRVLLIGAATIGAVLIVFGAWVVFAGAPGPTPTATAQPPTAVPTVSPALPTPVATAVPTAVSTDTPTASPTAVGETLDFTLEPTYGRVDLESGFVPDPSSIGMIGGGSVDASYLGGECEGFTDSAPDFRVNYIAGERSLLRFYFVSSNDSTLIVNDPAEGWACADDSYGTKNPAVDFEQPGDGWYDIWVGSFFEGTQPTGTLYITELSENHP